MAAMAASEVLNTVYQMLEGDDDYWSSADSEYAVGLGYSNLAIGRWEHYDNTQWRELWTPSTHSTASTATLTITAGVYDYTMPTNMRYPGSYVRTVSGGNSTYYSVLPPERRAEFDGSSGKWCYITGSAKDGYTLHFNPKLTLTTGDTIAYEYYRQASKFTAATSTTEMDDPYFLVYYILSRFYEADGEDGKAMKAFQESEDRLETMRVQNMSGYSQIYDPLTDVLEYTDGFGI